MSSNTSGGRISSVGVIIAAGGSGRRFGGKTPKQFQKLGNATVLERAISAFHPLPSVREIIVVAPSAHMRRTLLLCKKSRFTKVSSVVAGGRERQHSVWKGLRAFRESPVVVLVHDAVRPLVSRRVINAVVGQAGRYGAAIAAVPVKDTIKLEGRRGFFAKTISRHRLWAAQTPQGFSYDILVKAHVKARRRGFLGTDEASLVERLGIPIRIVQGEYRNVKLTTPDDLKMARGMISR